MSTASDPNEIHRAAFREARRRGDPLAAARAAAQLRIDTTDLDPRDLSALRAARLVVGRGIRDARARRLHPTSAAAAVPPRRRLRFPFALAATIVLAVAVLTALSMVPIEQNGGGGRASAPLPTATPVPVALQSRGRVITAVRVVVPVLPQPQPEPKPNPTAIPTIDPAVDAFPTDGNSVVPGNGSGTGPGFASCPSFVPAGFAKLCGQVVDASTNKPIPDACVSLGPCSDQGIRTDPNGRWALLLPIGNGGLLWFFEFSKTGYVTNKYTQTSKEGRVLIPTQRLAPTH
ncbi:MAG TPA: hypothetical protein VLI88_06245 [Patescibacteria group bacterium]|nr:hypothetical protein [Patescibacteria group bacterium]